MWLWVKIQNNQGTADFGSHFHLPGLNFGVTPFLTHSHVTKEVSDPGGRLSKGGNPNQAKRGAKPHTNTATANNLLGIESSDVVFSVAGSRMFRDLNQLLNVAQFFGNSLLGCLAK